jgi:hypothetical protein
MWYWGIYERGCRTNLAFDHIGQLNPQTTALHEARVTLYQSVHK